MVSKEEQVEPRLVRASSPDIEPVEVDDYVHVQERKRPFQLSQPILARDVVEQENDLVDDQYHELLKVGALKMYLEGLGHWQYRTGWSSSTLWGSPDTESTAVVYKDGSVNY